MIDSEAVLSIEVLLGCLLRRVTHRLCYSVCMAIANSGAFSCLQDLWRLLAEKASPEALLSACSRTTVSAFFEIAASIDNRITDWSRLPHLSLDRGIRSHDAHAGGVDGSDRAIQMRFDVAEALASIASAWPAGSVTDSSRASLYPSKPSPVRTQSP